MDSELSVTDSQEILRPSQAVVAMAGRLARAAANAAKGGEMVRRVECRIEDASPIDWLRAQRETTQYYWSERAGNFEMAGVGESDVVTPRTGRTLQGLFKRMRSRLSANQPGLRYYGGFRFHPGAVKGERWKNFWDYRFVLPRFEMVRRNGRTYLACNAVFPPDTDAHDTLDSLLEGMSKLCFPESPVPMPLPAILNRADHPDQAEWESMVHRTLEEIHAGRLDKAVLSRETVFTTDKPIDALSLLSRLLQYTMRSFEFCFHPLEDRAFIGASPERLYKRTNCFLQSEALAGTRPRGKSDAQDFALAQELQHSGKELREHQLVLERLKKHFGAFCRCFQAQEQPAIMPQWSCQHLYSRIEGVLQDNECDAALIEALHPTPALGGEPREEALNWIQQQEPFDRGIYGAPVGWVGYDGAEFCVAIRSGLIQGKELALYTGAGIVEGSVPGEEWDEIEYKMEGFLRALR